MFKRAIRPPKMYFLQKKKKPKYLTEIRKSLKLARILYRNPHKKAIVKKIRITTPRKPNSARRKTIKAVYKFNKVVLAYIPLGQHQLKQYNQVLLKGGGARDLPGIYVQAIRGKYDLKPLFKKRRRSIYGVKKYAKAAKC